MFLQMNLIIIDLVNQGIVNVIAVKSDLRVIILIKELNEAIKIATISSPIIQHKNKYWNRQFAKNKQDQCIILNS